jgi:short-subunit dehydrogenase
MNVSGRTVLLTGATGGIGHAIARRLHAAGATLVLTGRRTDVLEPLAAELGGARALGIDLADPAQVRHLIDEAGDADVLVANAALPASGRLHSFSEEEIDRALAVNLRAPIVLSRAMTERMVARGEGHVVLISSQAGRVATTGTSIYSATKFGLRGFGLGLRGDLRDTGVGVSVILPGFISEAGMAVDAGVKLPFYAGTNTPDEVATAVLRAIERDKAEIDVVPLGMRLGATVARMAPELSAKVTRRLGGDKLSDDFAVGQQDKR